MLNKGNSNTQFYTVSTFVIPFYYGSGTVITYGSGSVITYGSGSDITYGSGSAKAKSNGSYGSGSATLHKFSGTSAKYAAW